MPAASSGTNVAVASAADRRALLGTIKTRANTMPYAIVSAEYEAGRRSGRKYAPAARNVPIPTEYRTSIRYSDGIDSLLRASTPRHSTASTASPHAPAIAIALELCCGISGYIAYITVNIRMSAVKLKKMIFV